MAVAWSRRYGGVWTSGAQRETVIRSSREARGAGASGLTGGCFFFQAEGGIRVLTVTGVQTCALPISVHPRNASAPGTWLSSYRPVLDQADNSIAKFRARSHFADALRRFRATADNQRRNQIGRASGRERV